jgi:hypothetical protein
MRAMESSDKYPLDGNVDVDEFFVGGQEDGKNTFKAWLRGIHHHVTDLQTYIDEYSYRFNKNLMTASIFDNLIRRMLNAKPYYLYD